MDIPSLGFPKPEVFDVASEASVAEFHQQSEHESSGSEETAPGPLVQDVASPKRSFGEVRVSLSTADFERSF